MLTMVWCGRASLGAALVFGAIYLGACDQLGGSKDGAASSKRDEPKPGTASGTPAPSGDVSAASAPPTPAPLPAGRSTAPTLDEWNTQVKEVTVKGSSALNCETKIVREWFRVSCRGKNDSGGTPTTVSVTRGGRNEVMTYAAGGVTSMVMPFIEGTNVEAVFSWTDKSHKLLVQWPRGAPKPGMVGVFEGAASPLDGTAPNPALAKKLCDCHKKVVGAANCDDMMSWPDPDCDRTYGADCGMLLACSRGEPGAFPRCLPGFKNGGVIGRCLKDCSGGAACPAGQSCMTDWGGVCMSND